MLDTRLLSQPITAALRGGRPTVPAWIPQAALHALALGHAHAIASRCGSELYLARYWLTVPRRAPVADAGDCPWDSGNSVLLHAIVRPDDDAALHDHPWDFDSEILHGGYHEAEPEPGWAGIGGGPSGADIAIRARSAGQRIYHAAAAAHAIVNVQPLTWTLVSTGPRVRDWGFWPPGLPWIDWRHHLALRPTEAQP